MRALRTAELSSPECARLGSTRQAKALCTRPPGSAGCQQIGKPAAAADACGTDRQVKHSIQWVDEDADTMFLAAFVRPRVAGPRLLPAPWGPFSSPIGAYRL